MYWSIAGANSSSYNCASSPMTFVCDVASALAPAFVVYPSSRTAAATRACTAGVVVLLPDNAYDAVLRDTPAARATSPMLTMTPVSYTHLRAHETGRNLV